MHFVKDFTISDTSKVRTFILKIGLLTGICTDSLSRVAKLVSLSVDATVTAGQARSRRDCMSQSWDFDNQSALTKDGQRRNWQGGGNGWSECTPTDHDVSS